MKITYYGHESNGCDYYRAVLPLESLKRNYPEHKIIQRNNFNIINDIENNTDRFINDMQADVLVIPRIIKESLMNKMVTFTKDYNKDGIIVLDYDDNVFNVSPMSPHYIDYGTKEYDINVNGEILPIWRNLRYVKDGYLFDTRVNQERLDMIRRNMERADLVTCTTEILRKVFLEMNPNVKVLPNCVDLNRWKKLPLKETDEVRIYWSGGASHYEDFYYLKAPLQKIMEKYKNVKLVLLGLVTKDKKFTFSGLVNGLPEDRIELHDWEHSLAYPYKVAITNPTIGIIPLKKTEFNICKSAIKWIELSSLGVPCVTSLTSPYQEMIDLNKNDNGIFVEENEDVDAWVDAISMLIEDKSLREKLGQEAYNTVSEHFDINKKCHMWADAYKETLNERTVKSNA